VPIRARLQQLSVICALAALVAAPTAISAATTKLARGAIYVHVITKRGKPNFTANRFEICASKKPKASGRNLKSCSIVHDGQAALTITPGVWYLHAGDGTGQGRCYNKRNDGAKHASCSAVSVKSGRTMSLRWYVPLSG
jgi:hypothetical protein